MGILLLRNISAQQQWGGSSVFCDSSLWNYPVILDSGFTRSVVYEFCFLYFVEGLDGYNEVTDAFDEVSDLNQDVPEEGIAEPSPNYHYRFWVYYG